MAGIVIEEGAIYCLKYDGKESMIAVFEPALKGGKFVDVGNFVKKQSK